jgi:hypothetical protein
LTLRKKAIEVLEKVNYISKKVVRIQKSEFRMERGRTVNRILRPNVLIILRNFENDFLFASGF